MREPLPARVGYFAFGAAFVLSCVLLVRPALAQGRFDVPAACGSEAELKSELERMREQIQNIE